MDTKYRNSKYAVIDQYFSSLVPTKAISSHLLRGWRSSLWIYNICEEKINNNIKEWMLFFISKKLLNYYCFKKQKDTVCFPNESQL